MRVRTETVKLVMIGFSYIKTDSTAKTRTNRIQVAIRSGWMASSTLHITLLARSKVAFSPEIEIATARRPHDKVMRVSAS